ncbi:MAG: hypothetical protein ACLVB5_12750 [Christensenellales bacterium]
MQAQVLQGFFFTKAACSHRWRFADGRRLWRVQAVGKRFESSTDHQISPARLTLQGFFVLFLFYFPIDFPLVRTDGGFPVAAARGGFICTKRGHAMRAPAGIAIQYAVAFSTTL